MALCNALPASSNGNTFRKYFSVAVRCTVTVTTLNSNYQKADDKIFVCKFSKNVKSKLYYIENSATRGQTV